MARVEGRVRGLDAPKGLSGRARRGRDTDRFGRFTEWLARAMGTPWFIAGLTIFCLVWLAWNTFLPAAVHFDSQKNGYTVLTLVLSLQASYAAPLILLAQNRQDDRDRVQFEQDRQQATRNLADTEYLAREVVALRLALREAPTKDFIRQELRALFDELEAAREAPADAEPEPVTDAVD
ncbi:DUF1003 domain-containing protein [Gryllotalpicola reticulitermitis]|uniref:DUF1003 domain-containing protein n=1 Tax=Gryllotalpicola reticulitermitis TaxID=1184153 RepID=A0ABV8Q0J9_9MICO